MIHTPTEERIRRALPRAAQLAGIRATPRQLSILAQAAARAANGPAVVVAEGLPLGGGRRPPAEVVAAVDVRMLRVLASGGTDAEVARELGVSQEAARSRVKRMLRRLGVCSRGEAVARGFELGLLGGERAA